MTTTIPPGRRSRLQPLLLTALPLLIALAACGPSGPPPASPSASVIARCGAEDVKTGGIDGMVVDSEDNPLNDIYIFIQATDGFTGSTRTGEDGAFAAPGVSGEFQITTTDIAYAEVIRRVSVPCGELVEVELVLTPLE